MYLYVFFFYYLCNLTHGTMPMGLKNTIENMKKRLLLFMMLVLPMVASAYDIEVKNADGVTFYYNYINDWAELEVCSGTTRYSGSVVIPEEVTFMNITRKVTSIGAFAFYHCDDLTSVTIPNSVKSIGEMAFSCCSGLTSITIPNSVTTIGEWAFWCSGLTSVIIPNSVTSIGEGAFNFCESLTSVTVPSGMTTVGKNVFSNCSALTSVTIPSSVTSIEEQAFWRCRSLTSVTIPNSVTSIGAFAFNECSALSSVNIPNGVTSIERWTFSCCTALTSITIPNSVTTIREGAFSGCSALSSVTIPNSVTIIGFRAFDDCELESVVSMIEEPFAIIGENAGSRTFSTQTFSNAKLYVPIGTIDKYKTAEGWKDFANITEGVPSGITNIGCERKNEFSHYSLDGKMAKNSHKGINIIKMENGTTKKVLVK